MTDISNLSRLGQVNGAGDVDATFLTLASGEILAAFNQEQVTTGRFLEKTIRGGKSATFPFTGRTKARIHEAGTFIDSGSIDQNEKIINIDGKLLADTQISDLDELKNHYDARSIHMNELGEALANEYDMNNLRVAIQASRETTPRVTGEPVGEEIVDADADTVTANLVAAISTAGTKLTEKRIPRSKRHTYLRPVQYQLVTESNLVTNRDLGGIGSFARGVAGPINGLELTETINLPNTDESLDTDVQAKYRGDYSNVVAVTAHQSAVGVVWLMQMAFEVVWDPRRQAWLMIAKQATGHDTLRNSGAVSVVNLATP